MIGYFRSKRCAYLYDTEPDNAEEGFLEVLKHNLKGQKKVLTLSYWEANGTNGYDVREYWTDMSSTQLGSLGYKKADGFLDDLKYSFTKCYAKLENFKEAEAPDKETAESLRQMLESKAIVKFRGGFKTQMSPLQLKQIMFVIPIAIGAILGLFLLFGGGF